jgi:hypothetical protein
MPFDDEFWRRRALATLDHYHFLVGLKAARDLTPGLRPPRYVDRLDVDIHAAADEVWAALTVSGPIASDNGRVISAPAMPPSESLREWLTPARRPETKGD